MLPGNRGQLFPIIFPPHLGQVISIFPFPTGTRQIDLQFLQVKYLCSLSRLRCRAPEIRFFTGYHRERNHAFSALRLVRLRENIRKITARANSMDSKSQTVAAAETRASKMRTTHTTR